MSIVVTIDGVDAAEMVLQGIQEKIDAIAEGMAQAAEDTLMPAIDEASTTVWSVRTGDYSSSWDLAPIEDGIEISNSATNGGFPYGASLEYGWTTRNGGFVSSPGVAIPAVEDSLTEFTGELATWLTAT